MSSTRDTLKPGVHLVYCGITDCGPGYVVVERGEPPEILGSPPKTHPARRSRSNGKAHILHHHEAAGGYHREPTAVSGA